MFTELFHRENGKWYEFVYAKLPHSSDRKVTKRLNSSVSFGALLINLSNVLGCFQHEPTAVYPDAGEYEIIFLRLTFLLPKQ